MRCRRRWCASAGSARRRASGDESGDSGHRPTDREQRSLGVTVLTPLQARRAIPLRMLGTNRGPWSATRGLMLCAALLAGAAGCDDGGMDPPDSPCAAVSCAPGGVCSETDGLCHCGAADGPLCGEGETCDAEALACVAPLPEAVCVPGGSRFAAGTPHFREATADWGLEGVVGVRLNVTDVDGDGWADLVVRRGGQALDDFDPEGTRRTWLLRNTGAGFEDVTRASGLLRTRGELGPGVGRPVEIVAFADVDNDGDLDAYLGTNTVDEEATGGERSEILLNDGSGVFALGPESDVRSPDRVDVPAGASFVDVDRDGVVDLWVPQHNFAPSEGRIFFMEDRLYLGDGAGGFRVVTEEAGLLTDDWTDIDTLNAGEARTRAWAALARDLDGDGTPELLAASYGRSPNHLWRGVRGEDGAVSFVNESVASGYAYDDDLRWEDNQFARCFCRSNPEAEGCADVESPLISCGTPNWNHDQDRQPFRLGGNSGATAAGDVDNDGDLDLFTGEIKHWWAGAGSDGGELLVNESGAEGVRFRRPGDAAMGLEADHLGRTNWDEGHMTNALLDFDNDGRLDVYVGASDYPGNRGLLFHQGEPMRFTEVAPEDFFLHHRSHGVVVADFDRDGDLDMVVGHSRARCAAGEPYDCYETPQVRAFENVTPAGNWVQLKLVGGEGTNRAAIGAQVRVRYGDFVQLLEVDGGHGHYGSQSDLVLHVGLGEACGAEVEVRWPDAALTTETFTLPAGHRFVLTQGEAPAVAAR
ncbi:MAG: hypothetical protein CMN29_00480 [Sandaracinus sp.]|nr:hypothetical protein [Sandaracinus sp.]